MIVMKDPHHHHHHHHHIRLFIRDGQITPPFVIEFYKLQITSLGLIH